MKIREMWFGIICVSLAILFGGAFYFSMCSEGGANEDICRTDISGKFDGQKITIRDVDAKLDNSIGGVILSFGGKRTAPDGREVPVAFHMFLQKGIELNRSIRLPHQKIGFFSKGESDNFSFNIDVSTMSVTELPEKAGGLVKGNFSLNLVFCNGKGNTVDKCGHLEGEFAAKKCYGKPGPLYYPRVFFPRKNDLSSKNRTCGICLKR